MPLMQKNTMPGLLRLATCAIALMVPLVAAADSIPRGAAASHVQAVGYSELQGRPGFKMSIRKVGERWYLYMGHLWHRGWSIVDVTDPTRPEVVKFIAGPDNTWTIQMEIAGNTMITALEKIEPAWGGDPNRPNDEGVLIWDIRDPLDPKKLGQFKTGGSGTHRNFYAGGKYMHLAAGMPGYKGNIYVIVDISDPANPVEAGRWWFPGQQEGEAPGPPPATGLHGPPEVVGDKVFLSYGGAGMVILDISDVSKPKQIGRLSYSPPFTSAIGVHTVLPAPDKNFAYVNSEAIAEDCKEPLNQASIVDISDLTKPRLVSLLPLPVPPANWKIKSFCEHGGRFGPHNQNQLQHNPFVQKSANLLYLTYFNAGLRIFDVSTPTVPREVGYFVPPDPKKRIGTFPKGRLAVQTEDVLVDARGYIYITHKNQGLWILKYAGK
jgi:hypothetical protein